MGALALLLLIAPGPTLDGPAEAKYMAEVNVSRVPAGTAVLWDLYYKDPRTGSYYAEGDAQTRIIKSEKAFILSGPPGEYKVKCRLVKGEDTVELVWQGKLTGGVTPPIPPPVFPPPKPDDPIVPKPKAKELRVIMVYDKQLTTEQRAVVYGVKVEEWLKANTVAWRRRDKDAPGDDDPATLPLWKTVQSNLTVTPCVAVERDGKVEIINLEMTPTKMIEVLQGYK